MGTGDRATLRNRVGIKSCMLVRIFTVPQVTFFDKREFEYFRIARLVWRQLLL